MIPAMEEGNRLVRLTERIRAAVRSDDDAHAEGLAAGTGLLTGAAAARISRHTDFPDERCPQCGGRGEVLVVDLVDRRARCVCVECAHAWSTATIPPSVPR